MSHVRSMSLGQRSRSQLAFKVFAFYSGVLPITSSCMVGFQNVLAEIIITTRRCIGSKNHVARSKAKVAVGTYILCIQELCPTHNFIRHGGI